MTTLCTRAGLATVTGRELSVNIDKGAEMETITKIGTWVFLLIGLPLLASCEDGSLSESEQKKAFKNVYHVETVDGIEIRCSAINSTQLPEENTSAHNIQPDLNTGVLSCVAPLADSVTGTYRTIGAAQKDLDMRRGAKHTEQTWLGTYSTTSAFPTQFDITVSRPNATPVIFEFNTEE